MTDFKDIVQEYLAMNWLRPENAVCDTAAYRLIAPAIRQQGKSLEIGIGNGYNSFMLLGGRFTPDYDWFYNVKTDGFWDNADIYDTCDKSLTIRSFIATPPIKMVHTAIDHKQNLLDQAKQLDFVDNLICADASQLHIEGHFDLIFSNILYWLPDPFAVLNEAGKHLSDQGQIVTVFPNPSFYAHCRSYVDESPLWKRLNRGRADSMMWHLSLGEFQEKLAQRETGLKVIKAERYLAEQTLRIWDIGLRPLSPHLIKMAQALAPETRQEIKAEWCETCLPFVLEQLHNEFERGPEEGGYNFVVLEKTA